MCVCVLFFAFLKRIRAAVGASSKQPKKVLTFLSPLSGTFYFYFYYHFFLVIGRLVNVLACSVLAHYRLIGLDSLKSRLAFGPSSAFSFS